MPFKPGQPRPAGAGRKPGSRNKHTMLAAELMAAHGIEPIEFMCRIVKGDLPCQVCKGRGKSKYQPNTAAAAEGKVTKLRERVCQSCYGSGKEQIPPELILRAAAQLARFKHPELKEIEWRGGGSAAPANRPIVVERVYVQSQINQTVVQQPAAPKPEPEPVRRTLELPPAERTAS